MEGISKEAYGLKLSIYEAGEFKTEEGEVKEYSEGIKITVGNTSLKVTAMQLAGLFHFLHDDEVLPVLKARFEREKSAISGFTY
jgi:hypothetical protein